MVLEYNSQKPFPQQNGFGIIVYKTYYNKDICDCHWTKSTLWNHHWTKMMIFAVVVLFRFVSFGGVGSNYVGLPVNELEFMQGA